MRNESYPPEMAPSRYIEKISLATGEVVDEEVLPHQLLVHNHRDYHLVDVQARWLMSRLVGAVGDEELVVRGMKGIRKAALKAEELVGKVIGRSTSAELGKKLLGLKEREYYLRYKRNPLPPNEIAKRIRELQRVAQDKLDAAEGIRVLLTGGTGFVGKEVIWQAARHPDVLELVVVVRPRIVRDAKTGHVVQEISPSDRGAELLEQLWLEGEGAAKVRFVAGDIEEPHLGIDDEEFERLAATITHVVHSAASVAFDDPYEASFRANVSGAQNALAFSKRLQDAGGPFVAHVSIETSYIHGRQTRQAAREDEVVFPRNFYNNYYELTKALGSIETERYMLEEGLRVVQLCPSIVIGEAATGNNRGDTKVVNAPVNLFGRVKDAENADGGLREQSKVKLLANMAATFPADPSAELNIIPVDWVAQGIVAALEHPEAVGERVHLATDNRLTSQEICDTVLDELEVEVRLAEPTMHRNVTLPALTKVLESAGQDRIANALQKLGDIFGSYSEWGQPIHQVGNDQRLLGMPMRRPITQDAFRMLCRHNRWVQDYGRVRDLNEISRRERLWVTVLEEIEASTGIPVPALDPVSFREELLARVNPETFTRRDAPRSVGLGRRQALPAADTAWLQMDRPNNRMIIHAMVLFDEELGLDELRRTVRERLLRFERFHQRVVPGHALDTTPAWEDDPSFDIANHVFEHELAAPGDDAALNALLDELVSTGFAEGRSPWEFHVVRGWGAGGVLIARLHHCIGDGAALVYVMLSLTDAVDLDTPIGELPAVEPHHGPLARLAHFVERSSVVLHDHIAPLANPQRARELADMGIGGAASLGRILLLPADPDTPLRGPLDVPKRAAWSAPLSLDAIKAAKQALGVTVNDVLMALAGALRDYLIGRGVPPADLKSLRAIVPVNLRPPDETPELGNRFGLVFLELPVGVAHELARVEEIRRAMNELKSSPDALVSLRALQGMGHLSEALEEKALRIFTSKASLVASNVPGPYETLRLAGKAVKSCMFWVPQSGDIGVGISILSYAGEIRVGVLADANLVPDPHRIVEAFEREVAALTEGL